MTERAEKLAAERIVAAWKAKRQSTRPPGFSCEEASNITGVPEPELRSHQWVSWTPCSLYDDFEEEPRYSEGDLLSIVTMVQLRGTGVPPLVLALAAVDLADAVGRPDELAIAIEYHHESVYPLSYPLAEEWLVTDGVRRHVPQLVGAGAVPTAYDASEQAAERVKHIAERAECMRLVTAGDAALCKRWELAERLQASINAFWVEAGR